MISNSYNTQSIVHNHHEAIDIGRNPEHQDDSGSSFISVIIEDLRRSIDKEWNDLIYETTDMERLMTRTAETGELYYITARRCDGLLMLCDTMFHLRKG